MRRTLALTAALFAVSMACGDATGPLGPLDMGIIEGREQVVVATEPDMDPAVVRVWRDASGQAFLGVGPGPLYAQTTVTGVVGAVVCVGEVPIEGEPIEPHARCTATGVDGTTTFHLTHPKQAGTHRTPIVAEVDGLALTPDTVTAEVMAGPPAEYPFVSGWSALATYRYVFSTQGVEDAYGNDLPWMFITDCACVEITGDFDNWPQSRAVAPVAVGEGVFHVLTSPSDTLASGTVEVAQMDDGHLRWTMTIP